MAGFVVHLGATVMCMHGGQATPTAPNPRVRVSGMAVATLPAPHAVAGCGFVPPAGNGPCTMANWITSALRVRAGGSPLVLQDSVAVCVPTGTGVQVVATQTRVRAA